MHIVLSILILILSMVFMIFICQFIIQSIEKLMEIMNLSETTTGFIILSAISSLAELVVAIFAILDGEPGLSIGDIFGSHMFNIGLILGFLGVLGYLENLPDKTLFDVLDILLLASLVPLSILLSHFQDNSFWSGPVIGILLIAIYISSLIIIGKKKKVTEFYACEDKNEISPEKTFNSIKNDCRPTDITEKKENNYPIQQSSEKIDDYKSNKKKKIPKKLIIVIIIAGIGVIIAGRYLVFSALNIIEYFDLIPLVLGAKVIAIGTSLPEFIFCYTAVKKKKVNLAFGDVIGANLTTSTLVLGVVLIFAPFTVNLVAFVEAILFVMIMNIILLKLLSKNGISKTEGLILVSFYILFQAII